jgi:alkyl hydroperoxide reductase subunit AhpC
VIPIGHPLPDFSVPVLVSGEPGCEYRMLSGRDLAGAWKVIVYWPMAYLLRCAGELRELGAWRTRFAGRPIEIIGAVPDAASILHSWRSGRPYAGELPFPIVADGGGAFAGLLGLAPPSCSSLASAHLIADPWSRVRAAELHPAGTCRSLEAVARQLEAIQALDRAASTRVPGPSKRRADLAASA